MTLALLVGLNTLILAAHLVEEINTGFFRRFPLGPMPKAVSVPVNILVYSAAFLIIYLALTGAALALPLAWVFGIVMLSNGVGHLLMCVIKRAYFPGAITAAILLPASLALLWHLYRF